jgi:hypothetical protein
MPSSAADPENVVCQLSNVPPSVPKRQLERCFRTLVTDGDRLSLASVRGMMHFDRSISARARSARGTPATPTPPAGPIPAAPYHRVHERVGGRRWWICVIGLQGTGRSVERTAGATKTAPTCTTAAHLPDVVPHAQTPYAATSIITAAAAHLHRRRVLASAAGCADPAVLGQVHAPSVASGAPLMSYQHLGHRRRPRARSCEHAHANSSTTPRPRAAATPRTPSHPPEPPPSSHLRQDL